MNKPRVLCLRETGVAYRARAQRKPGTKPFKTSEHPALKAAPNSSAANTHGQWRRQANGPVHMLSLLSLSARTALPDQSFWKQV